MALFENFPYTNLHELNLDWLINELKKMGEAEVLSVNGQTGHVILYEDANVVLPEVQDSTWSFFRTADGVIHGISFAADGTAYIMNGDQLTELYTAANAPDFSNEHIQLPDLDDEQITNWNIYRNFNESLSGIQFDDTGSAYVISGGLRYKIFTQHDVPPYPVTSVNGQTGTVVLYPDPGVRFPDIIDNEVNYWSIFRYVNNGAYGIQFNTDGSIDLITPGNRTKIYTAADQPPYPVTSVNSMTGAVELDIPDDLVTHVDDAILEIAEPADNYTWGFTRETDNGEIGIVFDNQNNNGAYLRYYDSVTEEYVLVKLLTNDDIPASAGVSSVNGHTGAVTVNADNLPMSSLDNTTIKDNIDDTNANLSNLFNSMAIVINGNTASMAIAKNDLVLLLNSTITGKTDGIYNAVNAVSANTAVLPTDITNSGLAAGGLNYIFKKSAVELVENVDFTVTWDFTHVDSTGTNKVSVFKITEGMYDLHMTVTTKNAIQGNHTLVLGTISFTNKTIINEQKNIASSYGGYQNYLPGAMAITKQGSMRYINTESTAQQAGLVTTGSVPVFVSDT